MKLKILVIIFAAVPKPTGLSPSFENDGTLILTWTVPTASRVSKYNVYYSKSEDLPMSSFRVTRNEARIGGTKMDISVEFE